MNDARRWQYFRRVFTVDTGSPIWLWTFGPLVWSYLLGVPSIALLWVFVVATLAVLARQVVATWCEDRPGDEILFMGGYTLSRVRYTRLQWALFASECLLLALSVSVGLYLFVLMVPAFTVCGSSALTCMGASNVWNRWRIIRGMQALGDLETGDGKAVVRQFSGRDANSVTNRAIGQLMERDVDAARKTLADFSDDGPLHPATLTLAYLEAIEGRYALLKRWAYMDPGDRLICRWRWAEAYAQWMHISGARNREHEVRATALELPFAPRQLTLALVDRLDDPDQPLGPMGAYMEALFPWLGAEAASSGATPRFPIDVSAVRDNVFAPPIDQDVARSSATTVHGVFPVEWVPMMPAGQGWLGSMLTASAAIFVGAAFIDIWLGPALIGVGLLIASVAGMRFWSRRAFNATDPRGVVVASGVHPRRTVFWSISMLLGSAMALAWTSGITACLCMMLEGAVGILGGLPLALVVLWTVALIWGRTASFRFAHGRPFVDWSDESLDLEAWMGLGHLLRADIASADAAWRRSMHPLSGVLRQILHADTTVLKRLPLDRGQSACVLWRRGMAHVVHALRHDSWDRVQPHVQTLNNAMDGIDSPYADLLRAALQRGEVRSAGGTAPAHEVLDALERHPV